MSKTYTLTWWRTPLYCSTRKLYRSRFEPSAVVWPFFLDVDGEPVTESPILAFMHLCCYTCSYPDCFCLRLSSRGRLVARQATYQGV